RERRDVLGAATARSRLPRPRLTWLGEAPRSPRPCIRGPPEGGQDRRHRHAGGPRLAAAADAVTPPGGHNANAGPQPPRPDRSGGGPVPGRSARRLAGRSPTAARRNLVRPARGSTAPPSDRARHPRLAPAPAGRLA